jgi:NTE family protein
MVQRNTKTKVAIACQGGGSQTAFTAGALRRILRDPEPDQSYELVALSGTSGGPCAACLPGMGCWRTPMTSNAGASGLLTF